MNRELLENLCKNRSQRGIAEHLNVSQSTVRYWLKKFKLYTCKRNSTYTKEQLQDTISTSKTWREVCEKFNKIPRSGMQSHFSKRAKYFGIDHSHFYGSNWSNYVSSLRKKVPIEQYLVKGSIIKSGELRNKLIKIGLKKNECEICKISVWNNEPVSLDLDHKNSDHYDNRLENIQLLCPNCHRQETLKRIKERKKFIIKVRKKYLCICGKEKLSKKSKICRDCYKFNKRKIIWPAKKELLSMLEKHNYLQLSKKLGVSDNAIRHHLSKNIN